MLYDLSEGPPEPGSLLESVFILISKRRQEAEFYKTIAIVKATVSKDGSDDLRDSLMEYGRRIFPFLERQEVKTEDMAKKVLEQWTSHKALKIEPLFRPRDGRGVASKLRKGAERVKMAEELRRKMRHKRI